MRKFIVTAVCTLSISLVGMFGANHITSNVDNTSVEYTNQAQAVEQTNLTEESTASASELTDNKAKEQASLVNVTTNPAATIAEDEQKTEVLGATTTKRAKKTKVKRNKKVKSKKAVQNAKKTSRKNVQKAQKKQTTTQNNSAVKNDTVTYKNIDLSNCNTPTQVISQLNKNGITTLDQSDAKNFKSVQDILNYLQKNKASQTTTTTKTTQNTNTTNAAPTKTPTAAPTKAPTANKTDSGSTTTKNNTTTGTTNTAPSTNNSGISSYANQVLQLVNQERAKEGLKALTMSSTLTNAANRRAQETVQSFSHTRPNGTSFSTVLKEFNISYRTSGENLAYGQRTPQEVVTGWMNSPGHRANIMNGNFGKIGIGVHKASNGVIYWTQLFTD